MLRRIIESGTATNLIFYGPSGTGKTTVAGIIAKQTNKTLYHLNATTASLQDVKNIMADVGTMVAPTGPCCIWMRYSILIKNSSRACWSIWKTARSHWWPPLRKIRIFMCTTPCSPGVRCLSSSP